MCLYVPRHPFPPVFPARGKIQPTARAQQIGGLFARDHQVPALVSAGGHQGLQHASIVGQRVRFFKACGEMWLLGRVCETAGEHALFEMIVIWEEPASNIVENASRYEFLLNDYYPTDFSMPYENVHFYL